MLHNNKYDYSLLDKDNFIDIKIPVICRDHGTFMIRKSAHISKTQMYGCQKCSASRSKGEEVIIDYLDKNNINYEHQKSYNWITYNRNQPLKYDFYLPDYKMFIEYDGKHHFESIRYGGQSVESSILQNKKTEFYDSIKTMNAVLLGCKIVRIDYTVHLDTIMEILSNINNITEKLTLFGKAWENRSILCQNL